MTRNAILFIAALVALVGSLVAVLATQHERDFQLRGYDDPTTTTELPYRVPRLGVNAELLQYTDDELSHNLDLMQAAHVTWIRQYARWNELEPATGDYDWAAWDRLATILRDRPDLRLVVVLMNSPAWARPAAMADSVTAPPDDPAFLADFASAFAARYGDIVDYYQVWDEPNLDDAWGAHDPKPGEYAAILQAAYTAIHSADPAATVIAGALAPTTEQRGQNISDILYLEDLYELGAAAYFDAVAAKPYGFSASPDERTVHADVLNFSRLIALREIMQLHGDGTKALWAMQWGWNALPDDWAGDPSIWGGVTAQQQREYSLRALDRADREWAWLGGMILHHWQPAVPDNDPQWGFSIIDQNHQPTALYQALIQRSPMTARDGVYHPITPYARYSGVWTFGARGADIGWLETSDSQLEFDFSGRDVTLWLRENDYVAFLYPTIDGQPANATPQDNTGNSYIFLRSASRKPELNAVPVARDLPDGLHTLHVIADRGWDQWALAGYAVSSGNRATPYQQQLAIGWLTVVLASVAVIVTGWRVQWRGMFQPVAGILARLGDTGQFIVSAGTSIALMVGMLLTFGDGTPAIFRRDAAQLGILIIVTGGLVALELPFIVVLTASVALFVLIFNQIRHGLWLTLFWSPFFLFPVELYKFAFPMAELSILITGAAWGLRVLVAWGRDRQSGNSQFPAASVFAWLARLTALDWGIVAWVVLGVISLLWAEQRDSAATELRTLILEPGLFYLILRTTNSTKRDFARLVDALILAGILVAGIGLFLYARCLLTDVCVAVIQAEGGARRLASVYGSPNNVGLLLGRCMPFLLAYLLIPLKSDNFDANVTRRLFSGIVLMVMLITALLTQSVGTILLGGPAGCVVIVLLVYGRRAWLPIGVLAGLGVGIVYILSQVSTRFASLLESDRGTNFIRLRLWESTLEIIRDHPITGLGLDQFLYIFSSRYIRPDAIYDQDLSHPHNFILDFWVRLGIAGVVLFLWLQWHFWRTAYRAYAVYRRSDPLAAVLTAGTMGSMAALLAHGFIDNSVFVNDLSFIFVLLIGIIAHSTNTRPIDEARN